MKTQTWLPVFTGFYNTIFEPCDDMIEEDIKELDISQAKKDFLLNKVWLSLEYSRANTESEIETCLNVTRTIERELKELDVIKSIKMEEMVSPKFYNFSNDSINIVVVFTKKNVQTIKKIIASNAEKWSEYLLNHYKSYDGFMSSYDYYSDSKDWKDIDKCLEHKHKSGSILSFICQLNGIDEEMLFENNTDNSYLFISIDRVIEEYKEEYEHKI